MRDSLKTIIREVPVYSYRKLLKILVIGILLEVGVLSIKGCQYSVVVRNPLSGQCYGAGAVHQTDTTVVPLS
jgi:hypothetical protein